MICIPWWMLIFTQGGFQSVTKTTNVIGYHRMCNVRGIQSVMEIDYQCKPTFLDYVDVQFKWDILLKPISVYEQLNSKTEDIFFSHSDHLGSANWITDFK